MFQRTISAKKTTDANRIDTLKTLVPYSKYVLFFLSFSLPFFFSLSMSCSLLVCLCYWFVVNSWAFLTLYVKTNKKKQNKKRNTRKLSRFGYDIFGGCLNVCCWIRIRNIYIDGIVLSICCCSAKLHNVLKVSVSFHITGIAVIWFESTTQHTNKIFQKKEHIFLDRILNVRIYTLSSTIPTLYYFYIHFRLRYVFSLYLSLLHISINRWVNCCCYILLIRNSNLLYAKLTKQIYQYFTRSNMTFFPLNHPK